MHVYSEKNHSKQPNSPVSIKPRVAAKLIESILEYDESAKIFGEVAVDTEKYETIEVSGAVIDSGYENFPFFFVPKFGNILPSCQSFDLRLESSPVYESNILTDFALRFYGDNMVNYLICGLSKDGDEYVPFTSFGSDCAPEAESPDGDHSKFVEEDIKTIVWAITHSSDDYDFSLLSSENKLFDSIMFAADKARASAKRYSSTRKYSSDGFGELSYEAMSGCSLKITEEYIYESESNQSKRTIFNLSAVHNDVLEFRNRNNVHDKRVLDIPVWLHYTFEFSIDENRKVNPYFCDVEPSIADSRLEKFIPTDWLDSQQQHLRKQGSKDIPMIIRDSLNILFNEQPTLDENIDDFRK